MKYESLFTKTSKDHRHIDLEYGFVIRGIRVENRFQAELFVEDSFVLRKSLIIHGASCS